MFFNAHVHTTHVNLLNWWNQKAVYAPGTFLSWLIELKETLQLLSPEEGITRQHILVRFIIYVSLCCLLLGVSLTQFPPPTRVAWLVGSITENVLNGNKPVLKLVSSQAHPNVEELNVISTSSQLCCTRLPSILLFICTICNVLNLFNPCVCTACI